MFNTFTGSARRPRQVNLSGRRDNPFAAAQQTSHPSAASGSPAASGLGSSGVSGFGGGPTGVSGFGVGPTGVSASQYAVVQAQKDRQARQQERQRQHAAHTIRRAWRAHHGRTQARRDLRFAWDDRDGGFARDLGMDTAAAKSPVSPPSHREYSTQNAAANSSKISAELLLHLRRLVQFAEARDLQDRERIRSMALYFDWATAHGIVMTSAWRRPLMKLLDLVLDILDPVAGKSRPTVRSPPVDPAMLPQFLLLLTQIATVFPTEVAHRAMHFYAVLGALLQKPSLIPDIGPAHQFAQAVAVPLRLTPINIPGAYDAFALNFLTVPERHERFDLRWLDRDLDVARLQASVFRLAQPGSALGLLDRKTHLQRMSLLGAFVSVSRQTTSSSSNATAMTDSMDIDKPLQTKQSIDHSNLNHRSTAHDRFSSTALTPSGVRSSDFMVAFTFLADADLYGDVYGDFTSDTAASPLPKWVDDEILQLIDQSQITGLLDFAYISDAPEDASSNDQAQQGPQASTVAAYILSLSTMYPRKRDEIRSWFCRGSAPSSDNSQSSVARVSPLHFFWQALRRTQLFQKVSGGGRDAKRYLSSIIDTSSKLTAAWAAAAQETATLMLFLDLYLFLLRLMDDDEFSHGMSGIDVEHASSTRRNALNVGDNAPLITFLKSFAIAMLGPDPVQVDSDPASSTASGLSFFQGQSLSHTLPRPSPQPKDRNLDLIRGALMQAPDEVSALLRMLYERDSRRSFLPKDFWISPDLESENFAIDVVDEQIRNEEREQTEQDQADDEVMEIAPPTSSAGASEGQQRTQRYERQRQSYRRKMNAYGPRVRIVQHMPFLITFNTRIAILRESIRRDQLHRRDEYTHPGLWRANIADTARESHNARVRRHHIFQDAFDQFYQIGDGLKEPIFITFIDQYDQPEAGIDGGGVTKEFLTSITREAFEPDPNRNLLFAETPQHLLYPNPASLEEVRELLLEDGTKPGSAKWNQYTRLVLQRFEFLGRIIGKCLYEGILVDVRFAPFFLRKWPSAISESHHYGTGAGPTGASAGGGSGSETSYLAPLDDLRDLDEETYRGLLKLKNYAGDVADLDMTWEVTDSVIFDSLEGNGGQRTRTFTHELVPGGAQMPVTNGNRLGFIFATARWRLQRRPGAVTRAFLRGLGQIIAPTWLALFNAAELQMLLAGTDRGVDVDDLRRNTVISGVFELGDPSTLSAAASADPYARPTASDHPTIRMFWRVLAAMSDADRCRLLGYVTSTPRPPLLGFASLQPRFTIRDAGADQGRLPTASTCVNLLKLPIYHDEQTLRDRLMLALESGTGFELS